MVGNTGEDFVEGGKRVLSEGNLRVPLMIRIPGLRARPVDQPTSLIHLVPTLLDLAGVEKNQRPDGQQGKGLMVQMLGRDSAQVPVYGEVPKTPENSLQMSWLSGNLKLNFDGATSRWRLFDISRDPFEQTDLYSEREDVGARMKRELQGYRSQLNFRGIPISQ